MSPQKAYKSVFASAILIGALALSPLSAFAGGGEECIAGTVQNKNKTVENIAVQLLKNKTELVASQNTNASGYFYFCNVVPGLYAVNVEAVTVAVNMVKGGHPDLTIYLPEIKYSSDTSIELKAPIILSPKAGQIFTNFPRRAFLQWSAVEGADAYEIEVQCNTCGNGQKPLWSTVEIHKTIKGISYFTKPLSGDNYFRFYVRAIAKDGKAGPWSDFRYFSYKTLKKQNPIKPIALQEDCLPFDPAKVKIGLDNKGYVLTDGTSRMKVFTNESEAKMAMEIITKYKLDNHCFVGRGEEKEPMEYWLSSHAAPTGSLGTGEDCLSFNFANVTVQENPNGKFTLVDGSHWILAAQGKGNAKKMLGTWNKYGFNQICFVGRPDPSMTYYKK